MQGRGMCYMNKIVVVSLIADSADVVESFVRHSLTFADEMLIVEHNSSDTTWEILEQLAAEGLPIHIRRFSSVELVHAEVMTDLMWEAMHEYGADLVLPIDADEFLVAEQSFDIRDFLGRLSTNQVYMVHHWQYELVYPEKNKDMFLLDRDACRRKKPGTAPKVILGKSIAEKMQFQLAQGCHYAYRLIDGMENKIAVRPLPQLHLAHYQWRSQGQIVSKVINGWVSNAAKYSVHTARCAYWKRHFDTLRRGESLELRIPAEDKMPANLAAYAGEASLRYTEEISENPLHSLMALSEQLAQNYVEDRILQRKKVVSVILPYFGDETAFLHSLASIQKQGYPYKKIVVCYFEQGKGQTIDFALQQSNFDVKKVEMIGSPGKNAEQMEKAVQGEYVQWLLPGDVLCGDSLLKMLTALETDETLQAVLVGSQWPQDAPYQYIVQPMELRTEDSFFIARGGYYWQQMLLKGIVIAGGLSACLFRREEMERVNWLTECFLGQRLLQLSLWEKLLHAPDEFCMGVFREKMLTWRWPYMEIEDICWQELERYFILEKYREEGISPEYYAAVQHSLLDNYANLNKQLSHDIICQKYKSAMEDFGVHKDKIME